MKDRPRFAFTVADLKKKTKQTLPQNMSSCGNLLERRQAGAQGTRLAEWMFPLKPTKKAGGSEKRVSCRMGKHRGMSGANRMGWME